jgi:hypothetical protein
VSGIVARDQPFAVSSEADWCRAPGGRGFGDGIQRSQICGARRPVGRGRAAQRRPVLIKTANYVFVDDAAGKPVGIHRLHQLACRTGSLTAAWRMVANPRSGRVTGRRPGASDLSRRSELRLAPVARRDRRTAQDRPGPRGRTRITTLLYVAAAGWGLPRIPSKSSTNVEARSDRLRDLRGSHREVGVACHLRAGYWTISVPFMSREVLRALLTSGPLEGGVNGS